MNTLKKLNDLYINLDNALRSENIKEAIGECKKELESIINDYQNYQNLIRRNRIDISIDDPIYYKIKLKKLIEQAENEGLLVIAKDIDSGNGISIEFHCETTNEVSAVLLYKSKEGRD